MTAPNDNIVIEIARRHGHLMAVAKIPDIQFVTLRLKLSTLARTYHWELIFLRPSRATSSSGARIVNDPKEKVSGTGPQNKDAALAFARLLNTIASSRRQPTKRNKQKKTTSQTAARAASVVCTATSGDAPAIIRDLVGG